MNDTAYSANAIRVQLDPAILQDLIYGDSEDSEQLDDRSRVAYDRTCALREHQVYRLMRSIVSQLNGRLRGRREKFKLVEEGEGLVLEFSAWLVPAAHRRASFTPWFVCGMLS